MDLDLFREEFDRNFRSRGELGASASLLRNEGPGLRLAAGWQDRQQTVPWTAETPVLFWSATKGLASACLLYACHRANLELDGPVAEVWPEYACAGKEGTTFRQVLSHQAGQPALRVDGLTVFDHVGVAGALAAQAPFWPPGKAHGYHARTYGYLVDELVRRITGRQLGTYFRQTFGEPLKLDLWIGVPPELGARVAPIHAPRHARQPSAEDPFYAALQDPGSLSGRAFSTPGGLKIPSSMNALEARTHPLPSFGGIGTADALARFYQLLCAPNDFFSGEVLREVSTPVASGLDEVLRLPTAFSAGFMMDPVGEGGEKMREIFGPSRRAFGQPGAGGSHAFADPEGGLAFAYVMNQMEPGLFPNDKALSLVDAVYVHRTPR